MIYHAVEDSNSGKVYHASAALLNKRNPQKVIGHLKRPLFSPTEGYEIYGDTSNVVFPTGTAMFNNRLYIYYGAADKRIAVASVDLNELLDELVFRSSYIDPESEVGFTAGQVFKLCKDNEMSLSRLIRRLRKRETIILMAIGWLAREGKVTCRHSDGELRVITYD